MSVTFGIAKAKVAKRTAPGLYDTAVVAEYVQMMGMTMRVISAEGTGDDRIVVVASRIIAGSGQARFQGVPWAVLAIILGQTLAVDGVTPNANSTLKIPAGSRLPPFGIVGQGLSEESMGDVLLFAPNCKVTSDIVLGSMEYGVLSSVEFTFTAIDDGTYDILNFVERETTSDDFAIPPANLVAP